MAKYTFTFDAYVHIEADTEEQARAIMFDVEAQGYSTMGGFSVTAFPAYGITDNETGEEIREVH